MASNISGTTVTNLEHSRVSPPPGTDNKSLPLTFLDIFWLRFPPVHCLMFYEFLYSSTQSTSLIHDLKHSPFLAIKHFFPFVGNLILFPSSSSTTSKPEIFYLDRDSVPLTFADCTSDFDYFVGNNNPWNVDEFFPLIPQLPSVTKLLDSSTVVPLLAIQVTFFPNKGIWMGFTVDHVVGMPPPRLILKKHGLWSINKTRKDHF